MNKKVLTLSAVMASLLFGAHAHAADTRQEKLFDLAERGRNLRRSFSVAGDYYFPGPDFFKFAEFK